MLSEVTWINIHTLSKTTEDEIILEVRQSQGYGARWDMNYEFKGCLEPQKKKANAKKMQHGHL